MWYVNADSCTMVCHVVSVTWFELKVDIAVTCVWSSFPDRCTILKSATRVS
mgnify:CR=1 FL=1